MLIKVLIGFYDLKNNKWNEVDDTFEATEERFNELSKLLPGYVEKVDEKAKGTKKEVTIPVDGSSK